MEVHAATAAARATDPQCIQHNDKDIDIEVARSEHTPSCHKEDYAIDETTASEPLDRTVSRRTQRTNRSTRTIDPDGEPPDGGLNAWLKVYGCFLMYANTM